MNAYEYIYTYKYIHMHSLVKRNLVEVKKKINISSDITMNRYIDIFICMKILG